MNGDIAAINSWAKTFSDQQAKKAAEAAEADDAASVKEMFKEAGLTPPAK